MDDTGLVQLLLLLLLGFIVYLFISYLMLVIALNKKLYARTRTCTPFLMAKRSRHIQ